MLNNSERIEYAITDKLAIAFRCSGIYGIRHSSTGRIYVGSSKDVRSRLYQHFGSLLANKYHSKHLQNAWNKYGQTAFAVTLLEESTVEMLNEREQFWIDHFDSYEKGFNARPKAESMRGIKWSEAQNEARRISNVKAWANESLRQKSSLRFKGQLRGTRLVDSSAKTSNSLKKHHAQNLQWRLNAQRWLHSPENEAKRIASMKIALQRPEIFAARIQQLREASKSPKRITALRETYFTKYNRVSLGFKNCTEMDRECLKLHSEGKSCREIGRLFHIDHHAISSRLRRLGINLKRERR